MYHVGEKLGWYQLSPRTSSPLGFFGKYGANVIGGALLGTGMALSRSGPELLIAQGAAGLPSGLYTLCGAVAGGIFWTGPLGGSLVRKYNADVGVKGVAMPLDQLLGISKTAAVVLFEVACAAIVYATVTTTTGSSTAFPRAQGVTAGLLIGSAQLVSLLARRAMMGISGSYEDMGRYFWWLVGGAKDPSLNPGSWQNILFAAGTALGAWGLALAHPSSLGNVEMASSLVSPCVAVAGGALMVVGSRMAGGCTCGHGVSGLSLLSTASLVTMGSAFAAGAVVARCFSCH